MPVNQLAINVTSPSRRGLNTEQASSNLSPEWATEADNMVIDDAGRLASRKGYVSVTGAGNVIADDIIQMHSYDTDSGSTIISVANGSLYEGVALTDITGTLTPTAYNFQFANLNNACMGVELNETPIYYNTRTMSNFETAVEQFTPWIANQPYSIGDAVIPTTGNGLYYVATTNGTADASEPTFPASEGSTVVDNDITWQAYAVPEGDAIFTGYGRAWMSDSTRTVLNWSDLLIPYKFAGGSAGLIDLKSIWVHGMDEIVAVNGFNGFLIVFGRNSILIFSGTEDPNAGLTLVENIRGIGCIARDSVQHTGEDIIYLSASGVRSLSRVIQEKSNPVGDETRNVRSALKLFVDQTTDLRTIKSAYSETDGFYLLCLSEFNRFYVLDTRLRLEDGTRRITTWTSLGAKSVVSDRDNNVYFGQEGEISKYQGFLDGSDPIRILYKTGWIKLDEEGRKFQLKRIDALVVAASNTGVAIKWGWDFKNTQQAETQTTAFIADSAEYNISEFGEGEYGSLNDSFNIRIAPTGQGNSLQIELNTNVPNTDFRLQQLGLILKRGRLD